MCCGKKYKPNNLDNRIILNEIKTVWETFRDQPANDITDADWIYLYDVYNRAYPNSKGIPEKSELLEILSNASQLKTAYK